MEQKKLYVKGLKAETSFVYDFESHGEIFELDSVSLYGEITEQKNIAVLLINRLDSLVNVRQLNNAAMIYLDQEGYVLKVYRVSKGIISEVNSKEEVQLDGSKGYAVIVVTEGESCERALKSFIKGEKVRFKIGLDYLKLSEIENRIEQKKSNMEKLILEDCEFVTVQESYYELCGRIHDMKKDKKYNVLVTSSDGKDITERFLVPAVEKTLCIRVPLKYGANYITCVLFDGEQEIVPTKQKRIVFYKKESKQPKEIIMWMEQYVNAEVSNTVEKLKKLTDTAKDAGITAFVLDLKGVEGYASYKKATRTKVKYMTETKNPKKQITMAYDFLEEFTREAHQKGLKVYGSFNFFTEGNMAAKDSAIHIQDTHPEWIEVLHAPEDEGRLVSALYSKKESVLCYVNPANEEVQSFELERVREVLDHYDIDGVVMDRTRYDNQYADFSERTREKFEQYLASHGKKIERWPQDIYLFDSNQTMVTGPLYEDWLTFRSSVIQEFAGKLRKIVDEYQAKKNRKIKLAAYVGSWYDLYYQNGVNWADREFIYQEALNFPLPSLYTEEYAKTSYLSFIDFLMIGCYYETVEQVNKYITIGNIVTNQKLPVIGSVYLLEFHTSKSLINCTRTCINHSDGVMIFDLCYTDWKQLNEAIKIHNKMGITSRSH